jgi:hypothetical protein
MFTHREIPAASCPALGSGQKIVSDQTDGLEAAVHIFERPPMSGLGQTETLGRILDWSVHPLTADMPASRRQVSLVPDADFCL